MSGQIWVPPSSYTGELEEAVFFGYSSNWYHFLMERLPILHFLQDQVTLSQNAVIVMPKGLPANFYKVTEIVSSMVTYVAPYGSSLTVHKLYLGIDTTSGLRERPREHLRPLLPSIRERVLAWGAMSESRSLRTTQKIVFLSRRGKGARPLTNWRQVESALKDVGVQCLDISSLEFKVIIDLFQSCNLIMIESGAGMANILFSHKDLQILEIQPGEGTIQFWRDLSAHYVTSHTIIPSPFTDLANRRDAHRLDVSTLLQTFTRIVSR